MGFKEPKRLFEVTRIASEDICRVGVAYFGDLIDRRALCFMTFCVVKIAVPPSCTIHSAIVPTWSSIVVRKVSIISCGAMNCQPFIFQCASLRQERKVDRVGQARVQYLD